MVWCKLADLKVKSLTYYCFSSTIMTDCAFWSYRKLHVRRSRTASHLGATHYYQIHNRMSAAGPRPLHTMPMEISSRRQTARQRVSTRDYENRMPSVTNGRRTVRYRFDAPGPSGRTTIESTTNTTRFTYHPPCNVDLTARHRVLHLVSNL